MQQAYSDPSRRSFLKTAVASASAAALSPLARSVHAAGSGSIKIGLIGCGGRGSGAAVNAMNAGPDVKLVAMADLFEQYVRGSRDRVKKAKPDQVDVPDDRCFVGFDAYKKVIQSDVDVVLIAAASHFHPAFLKAAIDAGKHVFCEKPHGLDVPGVRSTLATCEEAKKRNLSVVSGLCWRYDVGVRETMQRVLDGAIGEILAIQETYITSPYCLRRRQPDWSEQTYQFQNWYHFNWLSGDQTAQQLIHSIDKSSWAMGDRPPVKAWGVGGRQVCTTPEYGDQFDHHAVVFQYDNGVRVFGVCRDQLGCYNETSDYIIGTKGRCDLIKHVIEGANPWKRPKGPKPSMYDEEHKALFEGIRTGKPINNSSYMGTSSLLAIMAQMVCYSGQEITWQQMMDCTKTFTQPSYSWDMTLPILPDKDGNYAAAMPGKTKML